MIVVKCRLDLENVSRETNDKKAKKVETELRKEIE